MTARLFTTFMVMLALVLAPSARAEESASPDDLVKILPFQLLMKLPKQAQIDYIHGLRQALVDLEGLQKKSKRPESARRRTNAQILFLKSIIERAEAADPRYNKIYANYNVCPSELLDRNPSWRLHIMSGARVSCQSPKQLVRSRDNFGKCDSGFRQVGTLKDGRLVCVSQLGENLKQYHALVAKYKAEHSRSQPKTKTTLAALNHRQSSEVTPKETQAPHRSLASKASAETKQAKEPSLEAPHETPSAESTPPSAAPVVREANKENRAPLQREEPNSVRLNANKFDARSKSNSFIATSDDEVEKLQKTLKEGQYELDDADQATNDAFASDVIALDKETTGDLHVSRRHLANFQTNTGDKRLDPVAAQDDLCKQPPDTSKDCQDPEKRDEAIKRLQGAKYSHCFAGGGMISHFDPDSLKSETFQCQNENEFCLNTIACHRSDGDHVKGAQVLLHCNSDQVICNPYLFDIDNDKKPFCVSGSLSAKDAMKKCAALSDADPTRPTFVLNTNAPNGTIEGWNEFANEFNKLCFDKDLPHANYFCEECALLKNRVWKLNAAALTSTYPAKPGDSSQSGKNLCLMMTNLRVDAQGRIGRAGLRNAETAKPNP